MKPALPPQQRSAPVHPWRLAAMCLLVATSLIVAACGGGGSNSNTGTEAAGNTGSHTTTAATPPAKSAPSTVSLAPMDDMLMFDTNTLTAKAGKVTIKFTNSSSISHNVTLINSANKILGKTPTFDGGTKSFTVTLTPGTYTYYCAVPGHRQAGMQGTLTVK